MSGSVDEEGRSTREQTGSGQPTAEAKEMRMTIEDSTKANTKEVGTLTAIRDALKENEG